MSANPERRARFDSLVMSPGLRPMARTLISTSFSLTSGVGVSLRTMAFPWRYGSEGCQYPEWMVTNLLDEGLARSRDIVCRGRHGEGGSLCRIIPLSFSHYILPLEWKPEDERKLHNAVSVHITYFRGLISLPKCFHASRNTFKDLEALPKHFHTTQSRSSPTHFDILQLRSPSFMLR